MSRCFLGKVSTKKNQAEGTVIHQAGGGVRGRFGKSPGLCVYMFVFVHVCVYTCLCICVDMVKVIFEKTPLRGCPT